MQKHEIKEIEQHGILFCCANLLQNLKNRWGESHDDSYQRHDKIMHLIRV